MGAASNDEKKFIIKSIKDLLIKKSEGLLKKADIRSLTFKKQRGGRIHKKTKKKKGGGEEINMPTNIKMKLYLKTKYLYLKKKMEENLQNVQRKKKIRRT